MGICVSGMRKKQSPYEHGHSLGKSHKAVRLTECSIGLRNYHTPPGFVTNHPVQSYAHLKNWQKRFFAIKIYFGEIFE